MNNQERCEQSCDYHPKERRSDSCSFSPCFRVPLLRPAVTRTAHLAECTIIKRRCLTWMRRHSLLCTAEFEEASIGFWKAFLLPSLRVGEV